MGNQPLQLASFRRPRRRWTRTGDYLAGRVPDKRRRRSGKSGGWFGGAFVAIPLAGLTALMLLGPPRAAAVSSPAMAGDTERASFPLCGGPVRGTCVVDGDTLWYRGAKIRIADINAPETSAPHCADEAALGHRATVRLQVLLNEGPFTLTPNPDGRTHDKYGRSLLVLTRGGHSLGDVLVSEGLAERWRGYRRNWC